MGGGGGALLLSGTEAEPAPPLFPLFSLRYDKGGALYAPSAKLARLCAPDLSPLAYGSLWLWERARQGKSAAHTIVCGAARPSDFDAPLAATRLVGTAEGAAKLAAVDARLAAAARDALGDAWLAGWWAAPSCWDTPAGVFFSHIAWLHTVVQAWGLHQFARDRYARVIVGLLKILKWSLKLRKIILFLRLC